MAYPDRVTLPVDRVMPDLSSLIDFYENLTPERIPEVIRFYTPEAWFQDPFHDVKGVEAIEGVLRHMFRRVEQPRLVVTETLVDGRGVMLAWELHYRLRWWWPSQRRIIRGVSHLRLVPDGRVSQHRDYWDPAGQLYSQLPLLSWPMRGLRALVRAR
ncbi:MAG: nuclear transport factor 2 family protein [Betaproteobacteria bacterium]|nr:nuclear transport factor 2 family protein [Betaproteobacteria bacterium]